MHLYAVTRTLGFGIKCMQLTLCPCCAAAAVSLSAVTPARLAPRKLLGTHQVVRTGVWNNNANRQFAANNAAIVNTQVGVFSSGFGAAVVVAPLDAHGAVCA
jgi:hypothetical protein